MQMPTLSVLFVCVSVVVWYICVGMCVSTEEKRKQETKRRKGGGRASAIDRLPKGGPVDLCRASAHCRIPHTTWRGETHRTRCCVSRIGHQAPPTTCSGCVKERRVRV